MTQHVNKDTGAYGACSTTPQRCPFGDGVIHFESKEEAQRASELIIAEQHEKVPSLSKKSSKDSRTTPKVIAYVGLPGSGKSTLAREEIARTGAVSLNRDDLREDAFGKDYAVSRPQREREELVSTVLAHRAQRVLSAGGTVIDDNTNTHPLALKKLTELAKKHGAELEVRVVDVSVEEAKRRNRQRAAEGGRLVPEHVIDKMAKNLYDSEGNTKEVLVGTNSAYLVPRFTEGMRAVEEFNAEREEELPLLTRDVFVSDLDGTLVGNHEALEANITGAHVKKKNFAQFTEDSIHAPINESVVNEIKAYREGDVGTLALTGRSDSHAHATLEFLSNHREALISRVAMAREGDFRGDYYAKRTQVEKWLDEGYSIVGAADDREQSIKLWNELGIPVSRVVEAQRSSQGGFTLSTIESYRRAGICVKCGNPLEMSERLLHRSCRAAYGLQPREVHSRAERSVSPHYLGFSVNNEAVRPSLEALAAMVPVSTFKRITKRRDERDGEGHYHMTVISPSDYRKLRKAGVEVNKSKSFDFTVKGVGTQRNDESQSWFAVVESPEAQEYRRSLGLDPHDFHVTLGFTHKDVHGLRKDLSTLI